MRPCSRTLPRVPRDAGSQARARLIAALGCSAFIHALITTGVPPGKSGRSGGAPSIPRAIFEVDLFEVAPEVSLAAAAPAAQVTTATTPRAERRNPQERRAAAAATEGAPRDGIPGISHIPDPTYYGARQLDVYPVLASTLRLSDREGAPTPRDIGRVLLLVLIDADGRVNEVSVIEAEPPGVFEVHARAAFQAARFSPALRNGRPVKSRLLVEVDYSDNANR